MGDFLAWYAGGTYSDGEKAPGVINIFFDENHNVVSVEPKIHGETVEVRVVVAWQASWFEPPAAKSKRVSADFIAGVDLAAILQEPLRTGDHQLQCRGRAAYLCAGLCPSVVICQV